MFVINFAKYWAEIAVPLQVLLILTGLDVVFGILVAVLQKRFEWQKVAGFMTTDIPYVLVWMATALLGQLPPEYLPQVITDYGPKAAYAFTSVAIGGSFVAHLAALGMLSKSTAKVSDVLTSLGAPPTGATSGVLIEAIPQDGYPKGE
jgi:hypothetical protein